MHYRNQRLNLSIANFSPLALIPLASVFLSLMILLACESSRSGSNGANAAARPTARVENAQVRNLTIRSADLGFDVLLTNPYATTLPLNHVSYTLRCADGPPVEGTALPTTGPIPPGQSNTIQIPVTISFGPLLAGSQEAQAGDIIPYQAQLVLSVDTPTGPQNLPALDVKGQLPIPALPKIDLQELHWQQLTFDHASATLNLQITNLNSFPVTLEQFRYALTLGRIPIARTAVDLTQPLAPSVPTDVKIPLSLIPKNLGVSAFKLLSGRGAGYDLSATMTLSTPFGPLTAPVQQSGQTRFRR